MVTNAKNFDSSPVWLASKWMGDHEQAFLGVENKNNQQGANERNM